MLGIQILCCNLICALKQQEGRKMKKNRSRFEIKDSKKYQLLNLHIKDFIFSKNDEFNNMK